MSGNDDLLTMNTLQLRQEISKLRAAIRHHRNQKADDRCIFDDDELYAVLGDGIKCDRRVGCKEDMLHNCQRFIERRCEGGGWPTYVELEQKLLKANQELNTLRESQRKEGVPSRAEMYQILKTESIRLQTNNPEGD